MRKIFIGLLMLSILAMSLVLTGCSEKIDGPKMNPNPNLTSKENRFSGATFNPDQKEIKTMNFESIEEYVTFINSVSGSNGYYRGFRGEVLEMAMTDSYAPMIKTAAATGSNSAPDFSGTNNQVAGVDEGDILKTDGEYIYTLTDKTLYIIKAYPGENSEVVSTINFEDYPSALFVENDKLAVIGNSQKSKVFDDIGARMRSGMSFVNIYDISDKEDPELKKEFKYEGYYTNSRMVEEQVYVITTITPYYRINYPTPLFAEGDNVKSIPVEDIHYFDIPYRHPEFVGVHAIDLEDAYAKDSKIIAVENTPNIYMSEENIYLTYTERVNEWDLQRQILKELIDPELPSYYRTIIEKIESTDYEILSRSEKESKIQQLYEEYLYSLTEDEQETFQVKSEELLKQKLEEYKYFEFTVINKITVDKGDIRVTANGKTPGSILNQFSMDEYDDVFRIGTTINRRWSRFGSDVTESSNNVYTLDKDLEIIGELEGLAKGEQIYSTRFMGDRLYMVTFRQIDPFFVIDLSNPKNPKELSELKIPGFSRYLHPYDENTIIGIGRDASSTGRQQGLKISLFDVTDVKNPKEIAKFVSDDKYAGSTAEYEHKAFLFSKEKNLLVIPVAYYNYQKQSESYSGAFVFNIDKNDIELRGLIDHTSGNSNAYNTQVERSLYIEDLLYTKSPNLLRINKLEDLSSVKKIELTTKTVHDIPVY